MQCYLQNAFRIAFQTWTDSKIGFTWCVCSSSVSFYTSCPKCESWSPIPCKKFFSWDLNRTLGFLFSIKFMFGLFPFFHTKPPNIGVLQTCLSRRDDGFKLCVCQKNVAFPRYLPAWCLKPDSFLNVGDVLFFKCWRKRGYLDFCPFVNTKNSEILCQVADFSVYKEWW